VKRKKRGEPDARRGKKASTKRAWRFHSMQTCCKGNNGAKKNRTRSREAKIGNGDPHKIGSELPGKVKMPKVMIASKKGGRPQVFKKEV